jgi:AraC-like DNA-binding protein
MRHILPGIHGFPMSQLPLVHTTAANQAVSAIHKLVEPFSFEWRGEYQGADVHVTGAMLERVKIFGVCHGAPVLVRSSPLRSHYIVLPLQGEVTGTLHQSQFRAASGEALVFPAGGRLHAHWGEGCVAIVLAIAKAELDREMCAVSTVCDFPLLRPKLDLSGGAGRSFLNVLACLCADADLQRAGDSSSAVRRSLQQALLLALLQLNSAAWGAQTLELENASTRRRRGGVARAVDYLHVNLHRTVDATELCRIAYLSMRSLQIGFNECFDMGPMTYSKRLRLTKAREELRQADPRYIRIADVSKRWGFECCNTFSRQYRQTFGELPSCTLGRRHRAVRCDIGQAIA